MWVQWVILHLWVQRGGVGGDGRHLGQVDLRSPYLQLAASLQDAYRDALNEDS